MSAWTLDSIPWTRFDPSAINAELVKVIKTAALVERNGADYGRYLANVFSDDPQFCAVADAWAVEEEQHGLALGRWAELADPAFDFDAAFQRFTEMYRIPVDATQSVRGSRTGELCARCVVESGTSSFYSAIRDAVHEPALKEICKNIAADEFRHYKLFSDEMARHQSREHLSTWSRLKVVLTRFNESSDDELASAYYAANNIQIHYDCRNSNADYSARAMAFYQRKHVHRAGHMMAQAAGLPPNSWATRVLSQVLWWVIAFKGRKFRALLTNV